MLALVAAGCGGGDSGPSDEEAGALLRQTFANQQAVRSGRLDLKMDLDAKGVRGVQGPVSMRLTGPFDNGAKKGARAKFDFDLAVRTGGASLKAGAVSDGHKGYLRLAGRAYTLDGALAKSLAGAAGKGGGGPTLSGLGLDPRRWLSDVRAEGEETVGGSSTVHISGDVDVKKLVGDLDKLLDAAGGAGITGVVIAPDALSGGTRDALVKSVDRAEVDIWTGKADKALRPAARRPAVRRRQAERHAARRLRGRRPQPEAGHRPTGGPAPAVGARHGARRPCQPPAGGCGRATWTPAPRPRRRPPRSTTPAWPTPSRISRPAQRPRVTARQVGGPSGSLR